MSGDGPTPPGAVVAVHPNVELYGSDRMLLHTLRGLGEGGWQVTLVLPGPGPLRDRATALGIAVELDPSLFVLRREVLRRPWRVPWALLRSTVTLWRRFRRTGAPLVLVNTLALPGAPLAARLAGKRVVCHVHEGEPQMSRAQALVLVVPLVACHRVIAISHSVRGFLTTTLPRLGPRTEVVHNGVDGPATPPPALRPEPAPARLLLLGRLAERKGSDVAIRALRACLDAGLDVTLRLVGSVFAGNEAFERGLHELVASSGVGTRVELVPFAVDVAEHLAWADIVLVPSRIEPFGLVAVEAQMAGRVVVASAVDGLREIVLDGETGFTAAPGSPEELAAAVGRALHDWPGASAVAAAGRRRAEERFGIERYRQEVVSAIAGALR